MSYGTALDSQNSPEWEVAITGLYKGKVANIGYMHCRRTLGWSSTSALGDVCNYLDTSQASINVPVLGTSYYIVSTSAQDGVAGTGIRSMRLNYLDSAGNRTITTVTLNGTTPVLVGNGIKYIQYMESEAVGSGGVAAGDIYLSSKSTAGTPTIAQTIEKVTAGDGRSMSGRVMVPTGFQLHLLSWSAGAISAAMDVRLRGTAFTDDRSVSAGYHFQQTAYLASGQFIVEPIPFLRFMPGAEIKASAIPSSAPAGNRCDCTFKFMLLQQ